MRFGDRHEAGRLLGEELANHDFADPVVLALPRGGVDGEVRHLLASASTDAKAG